RFSTISSGKGCRSRRWSAGWALISTMRGGQRFRLVDGLYLSWRAAVPSQPWVVRRTLPDRCELSDRLGLLRSISISVFLCPRIEMDSLCHNGGKENIRGRIVYASLGPGDRQAGSDFGRNS